MRAHGKDVEEWYSLSREARIFMTAAVVGKRLMEAMANDDHAREMEKKRPRGRGRRR